MDSLGPATLQFTQIILFNYILKNHCTIRDFVTSSALISFSFSEAILSSSYILTGSCNDLPDPVIVIGLLLPLRRAVVCNNNQSLTAYGEYITYISIVHGEC